MIIYLNKGIPTPEGGYKAIIAVDGWELTEEGDVYLGEFMGIVFETTLSNVHSTASGGEEWYADSPYFADLRTE